MRNLIVLQTIVLLLFCSTQCSPQLLCAERDIDCNACFDGEGCFYCKDFGCMEDLNENRNSCVNGMDSQVLYSCPDQCLPASDSSCEGCTTNQNDQNCFLNHTTVNQNEFCDFFSRYFGFGTAICNIDADQIRSAITNGRQNAATYVINQSIPITLTRNQLHIISSYDVCKRSKTGSNYYYPPFFAVHVEFQLNHHIKDLASNDHTESKETYDFRSKLNMVNGYANITQASLQFWTRCNQTAPVKPEIYVLNHNGMLVVGINTDNVPFAVVTSQNQLLDDEVVDFDIRLSADPAVRIDVSILLWMCSVVTALFVM